MSWSIFLILSIILIHNSVNCLIYDYTYSFTLNETDLNNFLAYYSISVVVYVKYQSNGLAQFRTSVYNLSPLHFSMYVNGENCGLLSHVCVFNLQKGESLNIKFVKTDQESELLSFIYIDSTKAPQINAGQCLVTFPGTVIPANCISAAENHTDAGNRYNSKLCLCATPATACSLITKQDSCISNENWWDNDVSPTDQPLTTLTTISTSSTTTTPRLTTPTTSKSTGIFSTPMHTTKTSINPSISPHPYTTLAPFTLQPPNTAPSISTRTSSTTEITRPPDILTTTVKITTSGIHETTSIIPFTLSSMGSSSTKVSSTTSIPTTYLYSSTASSITSLGSTAISTKTLTTQAVSLSSTTSSISNTSVTSSPISVTTLVNPSSLTTKTSQAPATFSTNPVTATEKTSTSSIPVTTSLKLTTHSTIIPQTSTTEVVSSRSTVSNLTTSMTTTSSMSTNATTASTPITQLTTRSTIIPQTSTTEVVSSSSTLSNFTTSMTTTSMSTNATTASSPVTQLTTLSTITSQTPTTRSHPISTTRSQYSTSVLTTTLTTTSLPNTTVTQIPTTETSSTMSLTSTTFAPSGTPTLKNLSDSIIGINNVSKILNETLVYSRMGSYLNSTQVYEISTILYNSASVPGLTSNDSVSILQNLDNILNVNEETMYQSGSSSEQLLSMLPLMVHNTDDGRIDYLQGSNLGFTAKKIDCTNLDSDNGILDLGSQFELINSTSQSSVRKNSIVVPLTDLCSTQDLTHVFFTIYRQRALFVGQQQYNVYNGKSTPISKRTTSSRAKRDTTTNETQTSAPSACARQTSVTDSPVMSATILNNGVMLRSTTTDAIMAVVKFNISEIQNPLHGNLKVTWWDTGRLQWATDRQCTIVSEENGIVTANCLHLTDFAIIVDAALNDPNVCDAALIDLGYVVNGISIVCLIFLSAFSISTYSRTLSNNRFFKIFQSHTLVRRDFIVLAYHIDLLLFYLLFTIFSNQETSGSLCTTMAAIMYALLVCSLLLTIFQGIRNILTFLSPRLFRVCSILLSSPSVITLSVVIPFSISILLLVFSNFFDRQDCFCWVRPDYVIFAIVLPVTVLILNTLFCTALIIYKVFFGMKRKFSSREGHHHYDPNVVTKIVSIIVMQVSLGMPWILQFGTLYSPYTTFWHYLFTIVMGSQGTTLLFIFFYKKYKLRAYESEQRSSSRIPQSIRKRAITDEEILGSKD